MIIVTYWALRPGLESEHFLFESHKMEPVCALAEMGGDTPAWEVETGCYRGSPHRMAEDRACNYFLRPKRERGLPIPSRASRSGYCTSVTLPSVKTTFMSL